MEKAGGVVGVYLVLNFDRYCSIGEPVVMWVFECCAGLEEDSCILLVLGVAYVSDDCLESIDLNRKAKTCHSRQNEKGGR